MSDKGDDFKSRFKTRWFLLKLVKFSPSRVNSSFAASMGNDLMRLAASTVDDDDELLTARLGSSSS